MELSEEEKEAIEYLENRLDILHNNTQWATEKSIKVILNLIDKQQKEIEEKEMLIKILRKTKPIEEVFHDLIKEKEYINKDKIREKLKEIENRRIEEGKCELAIYGFQRDAKIEVLQELLEENK